MRSAGNTECLDRTRTSSLLTAFGFTVAAELIAEFGTSVAGTRWSTWRGRGYRRGKPKQCFATAWRYTLNHEDLSYSEGVALSFGIPVHHACCTTEDARVVDPTWRHADEDTMYVGIVFPRVPAARLYLEDTYTGHHFSALQQRPDLAHELRGALSMTRAHGPVVEKWAAA